MAKNEEERWQRTKKREDTKENIFKGNLVIISLLRAQVNPVNKLRPVNQVHPVYQVHPGLHLISGVFDSAREVIGSQYEVI